MRLERHTRRPDTDAACFSRMSASFTLHARSGGLEIKSCGAHVTESHWVNAEGAGSSFTDGFYLILIIHSQN